MGLAHLRRPFRSAAYLTTNVGISGFPGLKIETWGTQDRVRFGVGFGLLPLSLGPLVPALSIERWMTGDPSMPETSLDVSSRYQPAHNACAETTYLLVRPGEPVRKQVFRSAMIRRSFYLAVCVL